jgi:hypothetical protein
MPPTHAYRYTNAVFVSFYQKIFLLPNDGGTNIMIIDPFTNTTTTAGLGFALGITTLAGFSATAVFNGSSLIFAQASDDIGAVIVNLYCPMAPTVAPTALPTTAPSARPTRAPTPAPTLQPTASPTAAPTSCADVTASYAWEASDGVVTIPPLLGGCDLYSYAAIPTTIRLPNTTTTLRFPGPGLNNPSAVDRFASWVADLPGSITLDLAGNEFTQLPPSAFSAFGQRVVSLDLSRGRIASVHPNALAGLTALRTLSLASNAALESLPNGWLAGRTALQTLDLSGCALASVSNATLIDATSLTAVNLNDNPILSMDSSPFPPAMSVDGVSMVNTSLICVPASEGSSTTRPLCVACSPMHNPRTLLVQGEGEAHCDFPAEVTALVGATQYVPPYSGATDDSYLTYGARTKWAIGRTYSVQPVTYTGVQLLDGREVPGPVAFSVTNSPDGLFVDVHNGQLLFVPRELQAAQVSTVTAQHTSIPGVADVGNLTFEVLHEDVLNPDAQGPNGLECANNGTKTDGPCVVAHLMHMMLLPSDMVTALMC